MSLNQNTFIVKIEPSVQKMIDLLHSSVKQNTEWSGAFYYTMEGSLFNNPTFTIKGLLPLNIGTSSYTEYTGEEMTDLWEKFPEMLEQTCFIGHMHTHHSMTTFFSQVDNDELKQNAKNYPFYLSVIVNYAGSYNAKVAVNTTVHKTITYNNGSGTETHTTSLNELIELNGTVVRTVNATSDMIETVNKLIEKCNKKQEFFNKAVKTITPTYSFKSKKKSPLQGVLKVFEKMHFLPKDYNIEPIDSFVKDLLEDYIDITEGQKIPYEQALQDLIDTCGLLSGRVIDELKKAATDHLMIYATEMYGL